MATGLVGVVCLDAFPVEGEIRAVQTPSFYRFLFAFLAKLLYAGFATQEVAEWTFKKN
jgi:hypothetical protein